MSPPPDKAGRVAAPGGPPALPTGPDTETAERGLAMVPAPEVLDGS